MNTLYNLLVKMQQAVETKRKENYPFNERELAKAELVYSLLRKVDSDNPDDIPPGLFEQGPVNVVNDVFKQLGEYFKPNP